MKYKLYLTLVSEDGKQTLEKVMFVDERTVGRHDIYGEAVEEMYNTLVNSEEVSEIFPDIMDTLNKLTIRKEHPTPLEVDLSPDDEVYKPSN